MRHGNLPSPPTLFASPRFCSPLPPPSPPPQGLRWGQRQLLSSRGKDQSSGEAVDPPQAGPGSAEHTGELEDIALLEQGDGRRRERQSWDSHVPRRAHPGSHVQGTRLRGGRKVQGVTPQHVSFLLLLLHCARRLEESCMLHTSMPAATRRLHKYHGLDLD